MPTTQLESNFLNYLIKHQIQPGERVPTLSQMSKEMGISVGKLREQLELARSLGIVSVRTRVGIQREPFDFLSVIRQGIFFGLESGEANFADISQLRQAVEIGFWDTAVRQLTAEDKIELRELISCAWQKLRGEPIHVPASEHRQLHLKIFSRLENPFVQGILAAYWDVYQVTEITRFTPYQYWADVWSFHEKIVDALGRDAFDEGKQLLIEHFSLLPKDFMGAILEVEEIGN